MVCIELCSTRTMGRSALSGIVDVRQRRAGGRGDIRVGNEARRGPLASVTLGVRLRQSGGQLPNGGKAGVVTGVADTCACRGRRWAGGGGQAVVGRLRRVGEAGGRWAVCVSMREAQGGSGSLCIKARPVRKLRGQGWAGATADTEGATWAPTPGHPPLHSTLALNRPSQALPETPRHCTSWPIHGLLAAYRSFHESLPLLTARAAGWRVLHDTICCRHAPAQRCSFLLRCAEIP